jgi:hypothetical protein
LALDAVLAPRSAAVVPNREAGAALKPTRVLRRKTLLQQLETFGPLCPVVPSISFLRLFVLTGIAARDVDHALGELGGIAGALAVACHAIIVPPREDFCTVGLEMGHIRLRP